MSAWFHKSCLVPVSIPGMPSFVMQIYGFGASEMRDHILTDLVVDALCRRGIDPFAATFTVGFPRHDMVLARTGRKPVR
jgi:hypothetical protein